MLYFSNVKSVLFYIIIYLIAKGLDNSELFIFRRQIRVQAYRHLGFWGKSISL